MDGHAQLACNLLRVGMTKIHQTSRPQGKEESSSLQITKQFCIWSLWAVSWDLLEDRLLVFSPSAKKCCWLHQHAPPQNPKWEGLSKSKLPAGSLSISLSIMPELVIRCFRVYLSGSQLSSLRINVDLKGSQGSKLKSWPTNIVKNDHIGRMITPLEPCQHLLGRQSSVEVDLMNLDLLIPCRFYDLRKDQIKNINKGKWW